MMVGDDKDSLAAFHILSALDPLSARLKDKLELCQTFVEEGEEEGIELEKRIGALAKLPMLKDHLENDNIAAEVFRGERTYASLVQSIIQHFRPVLVSRTFPKLDIAFDNTMKAVLESMNNIGATAHLEPTEYTTRYVRRYVGSVEPATVFVSITAVVILNSFSFYDQLPPIAKTSVGFAVGGLAAVAYTYARIRGLRSAGQRHYTTALSQLKTAADLTDVYMQDLRREFPQP